MLCRSRGTICAPTRQLAEAPLMATMLQFDKAELRSLLVFSSFLFHVTQQPRAEASRSSVDDSRLLKEASSTLANPPSAKAAVTSSAQ
jgi:hypothetical protein